jgi:chorismate mutase
VESGLDPAFTEQFLRFIVAEVIHHHKRIADGGTP